MRLTPAPDFGVIIEMSMTIMHRVLVSKPSLDVPGANEHDYTPITTILRFWRHHTAIPMPVAVGTRFAFNEVGAKFTGDALSLLPSTTVSHVTLEESSRVLIMLSHFSMSLIDRSNNWRNKVIQPALGFSEVKTPEQHEQFVSFVSDRMQECDWARIVR